MRGRCLDASLLTVSDFSQLGSLEAVIDRRELQRACEDRHERVAALLSELLVGGMSAAQVEAKCQELSQCHEEFQPWGDDEGNRNPWHVEPPQFIWGAMVHRRAELRGWLALAQAHFPSSPELARETRERLLADGAQWRKTLPRR
jgi:hypothetical protein